PVLFLHGGPGGGCSVEHRRFFDPDVFRVVLFDQRGAGNSTPLGEAADNTTRHLVRDIETLREYLGVEKWLVFGGSWGATLALAYGQAHPERCLGFVLRGVFLGRPHEIEWFLYGLRQVFPEAWRRFAGMLPAAERGDLLGGYLRRLFDDDARVHVAFARAWESLGLARLEAHYFSHQCFLAPEQLLVDLHRIRHLPASIVHGRYDMVCPIASADELARAWPGARYEVVPDGGHSVWEPPVRAAVIREVERFKRLVG
ncbi:MAG: alpha/beta fold hydrolase, partial [Burkholderiaceae bacterium]|nr:alpha/beta fold hydrolase [Burkholderiaceae bacterium]